MRKIDRILKISLLKILSIKSLSYFASTARVATPPRLLRTVMFCGFVDGQLASILTTTAITQRTDQCSTSSIEHLQRCIRTRARRFDPQHAFA